MSVPILVWHGLCFSDVIVSVIDTVLHEALEALLEKEVYRAGDPHQREHQIKVVQRGMDAFSSHLLPFFKEE